VSKIQLTFRICHFVSFRDRTSRKPIRKYPTSVPRKIWSKIKWRRTLSVSDVTLKLESAVAPFEFQSHVSESTTNSKSCDWTDGT